MRVTHMMDTDACIDLIRHRPEPLIRWIRARPAGAICISAITAAELYFGADNSSDPEVNRRALAQFLLPLKVASFDTSAASAYGQIRAELRSKGTPIGAMDTLVAAHALSRSAKLITGNAKQFARVPGLVVELPPR